MTADDPHLTAEQVAGYLANTLAPGDRGAALGHLDRCSACRAELLEVGRIVADAKSAPGPARAGSLRRRLMPVALALAAGIAAIAVSREREPEGDSVTRAVDSPGATEGVPLIAVIAPPDGAVVADSVMLRWHSLGRGSYDVFLLEEDGRPLWSTSTTDTTVRVPPTVALRAGATYFWRVDAMGNGIMASTGVRRLTVAR